MNPISRQARLVAVIAGLMTVLAACGSAVPSTTAGPAPTTTAGPIPTTTESPAPTPTAPPTTASPTTTIPPTPTTAAPACSAVDPIPSGSQGLVEYVEDLSGDGTPDTVTTYRNEEGGFFYMHVAFGEGGGSVHELIDAFDPQGARVLGSNDVEGNGTPEIFVKVGGGAYTQAIALFDVTGCAVTRTTSEGAPIEFLVGSSVSNVSGFVCESGGISTQFASVLGDGPDFEGGFAPFTLTGTVFTAGFGDGAGFTAEEAFGLGVLGCPGVSL